MKFLLLSFNFQIPDHTSFQLKLDSIWTVRMAATTRCMNGECATTSAEWRRGWQLRSGGFAVLCHKCGGACNGSVNDTGNSYTDCSMAYEQSIFCDLFHLGESGWRECTSCSKRLHCGCVASKHLVELVDKGGVQCFTCAKNSGPSIGPSETIPEFLPQSNHRILSVMARTLENEKSNDGFRVQIGTSNHTEDIFSRGQAIKLGKNIEIYEQNKNILSHRESHSESFAHIKREQLTLYTGQTGNTHSGFDSRDQARMISAAQQAQRGHHLLARPTKMVPAVSSEASKEAVSQMRVARPPTDGKGRNQLLPRYWPRITDQELQQISGDSNSTVVPLFEKVLSASDAGRIGRLVLPKACAEAYFPPISQPEGIPLKIQDAKGKEWHFQFRFWPNNNSRMYVLEGVTPCIQSLQLQAGDTVTFSRMDPAGKLIMGFRKATNYVPLQDSQISAIANAGLGNDSFFSSSSDNLILASGGYSGLFQSFKGNADPRQNYLSEHLNLADGDSANVQYHQDRKKTHNIKSKRLLIGNEDALDLKVSWEEAQDLLRPSPTAKPSVVRIEDQEFEEYEEPPVFGKRTIFTVQSSGDQDQWIQCDNCFKWRRLPVDVLVPSTWTCNDNTWDPQRSSCSKPEELSPAEIQNLLHQISEMKRQRTSSTSCNQGTRGQEACGHDTIGNAATSEEPSNQATTTKHPRHRPGCTCIVCIQPPSGKGPKHHTNCTCNVCMTVKRRFKTLMLRKKKRQSEKEEAEANKRTEGSCSTHVHDDKASDVVLETNSETAALDDAGKGQIDLNALVYEEHNAAEASASSKTSMIDLVHVASLPLDNYLKQNGLTTLACEEETPIESEEDCSGDAKSDAS